MSIFLWIFVINYSKIYFIGIFYKETMLKRGFHQAYSKHLLKRIIWKFISYFYELYCIFYIF
jgi:hypothetical protein